MNDNGLRHAACRRGAAVCRSEDTTDVVHLACGFGLHEQLRKPCKSLAHQNADSTRVQRCSRVSPCHLSRASAVRPRLVLLICYFCAWFSLDVASYFHLCARSGEYSVYSTRTVHTIYTGAYKAYTVCGRERRSSLQHTVKVGRSTHMSTRDTAAL